MVLGYGSFQTTSTIGIAQNAAMRDWTAGVSGGATPISTVGGTNNTQITLPVAGDYLVQFQMNRKTNNNTATLQVYTGAGCTSTQENVVGTTSTSGAITSAAGIIRTTVANTTLQICQKFNATITPSSGATTGLLTVMRLN
jgi:hypothetical protein